MSNEVMESKIISSLLRKVGLQVLSVPNQSASVDALVRRGEVIDLAIIDVGKPTASDAALLRSLHEGYPQVRLVFMSSDSSEDGTEVGSAGHVRGYVHKPVRKAQLLGTILTVMDAPSVFAA